MSGAVTAIATAVSAAAANAAGALTISSAVIDTVSSLTYAATSLGVITGGLLGVNAVLAPKVPDPTQLQTPLKQPMPIRQSAFGTVRVGGAYMLFCTGSTNKNIFYGVQAHLDGESDAQVSFYLNDDLMAKTASGNYWFAPGAPGKYGGGGSNEPNLVRIDFRLGATPETAYAISADVPVWDANHRGDGITSTLLRCKQAKREDQAGDFPNGVPQLSAVWRAQKVYDPRDGAQTQGTPSTYKWSDNPVLCLLAYLTDASGGMGMDYARFILPAIDLWKDAADECDGLVSTSGMHATLLDDAAAGDHKIFLADTTGLTVGTVIQLATESVTVSGLGLAGEVDFVVPASLAYPHSAGELANWSGTGQKARYSCNLTYGHNTPPGDVIKAILSSFDGWLGQRGDGALVVRTNTVYDPGFTLSASHIVGFQLQSNLPDEQAINQYVVAYTDPASGYNKAEAGYVEDDIDIAQRGQVRSQELYLQTVPSGPQAIVVARSMLSRATQLYRGTLTCNFAGLAVMGHRYVPIQIVEAGATLFSGIAEITGKPTINLQSMQVSFPWVAASTRLFGNQALCMVLDVSKAAAGNVAAIKGGAKNALQLIAATIGSGLDIAVVACDLAVTSIVRRAATASDLADIIAFVDALVEAADVRFDAELALTTAKTFFDGTDAGITNRRIVFPWDGYPDKHSGTDPTTWPADAAAAQAVALSMPDVKIFMINVQTAVTTWAAYLDNTPEDGIPVAPTSALVARYIEQAVFGTSSTSGSGYTLPPLGPPSGAALQPLAAPVITSVTPDYPNSGGGVQGARLSIVMVDPGVGNVTWKAQWKKSTDTLWAQLPGPLDADGAPPTILTGLIAASGSINVQVAYVAGSQQSPWSATTTLTVAAPLAGIAAPTASAAVIIGPGYMFDAAGVAKVVNADAAVGDPTSGSYKPCNCWITAAAALGATASVIMPGQYVDKAGLSPGATYWLASGGGVTNAAPAVAGNLDQVLGVADDTGAKLFFAPQRGIGV